MNIRRWGGFFIHLQNGDHLPSLLLRGGYENEFPYEKYEFIIKSKKLGRLSCSKVRSLGLVSLMKETDLFNPVGQHLLQAYVPDSVPFILCITSLHTQKNARDRQSRYLCLPMRKPGLGEMK